MIQNCLYRSVVSIEDYVLIIKTLRRMRPASHVGRGSEHHSEAKGDCLRLLGPDPGGYFSIASQ